MDFLKNDLVAVFGGEFDSNSRKTNSVSVCTVKAVGQDDLLVEYDTGYVKSCCVVPKQVCLKLHLDPDTLVSSRTRLPKIGDLVVSFIKTSSYAEVQTKTGILDKISYKLGKPDTCDLMCGTTKETVAWEHLLVLESK